MGFWKHAFKLETYEVYHMPGKTGYRLDDELCIVVVNDGAKFIATCVDRTISLAHGTGKTTKAAVKDLFHCMVEIYELDERDLRKGKLNSWRLAMHERQGLLFSKR